MKDQDSGKRMGLFHASRELCDAGLVDDYQEEQLIQIRDWFNNNLEKPTSFSKSSKPHAKGVVISWFKHTASEHLSKMYEMAGILEAYGFGVDAIKTERIGYIVYEDQYQATAEPFADTPT